MQGLREITEEDAARLGLPDVCLQCSLQSGPHGEVDDEELLQDLQLLQVVDEELLLLFQIRRPLNPKFFQPLAHALLDPTEDPMFFATLGPQILCHR